MNQEALYITFEEYQVAVYSNEIDVLNVIKKSFVNMLSLKPRRIIECFNIFLKGSECFFNKGSENNFRSMSLAAALCNLKYEVVTTLINARPDLLWLHAGAVAYQGSAIVIPGCSGCGKSTLVVNLCARGWSYLSDDVLPLSLKTGKALPFPKSPEVRESIGKELPPEQFEQMKQTELELKPAAVCNEAMPIKAIIFPTYGLNFSNEVVSFSPATTALKMLQNCMNFPSHKQIAVNHVCQMVMRMPTFCLSYSDSHLATDRMIDFLNQKLCLAL